MGVQRPTPHAEASAHGYALEAEGLRPIEGEAWYARPGGRSPGLITNYFIRPMLVEEGEYDTLPPPEEVRGQQRARISQQYVQERASKQRQVVKRKLGPMAKAEAKNAPEDRGRKNSP